MDMESIESVMDGTNPREREREAESEDDDNIFPEHPKITITVAFVTLEKLKLFLSANTDVSEKVFRHLYCVE